MLGLLIGGSIAGAALLTLLQEDKNKICDYNELYSYTGDGVQVSKNVRLSRKMSKVHVLKVAPSDSFKSRGFIMPNVRQLNDCSMVVFDPSEEVQQECQRQDLKELIFNPFNINKSIGFNPLFNCKDSFEVKQTIELIMLNSSIDTDNKGDKVNWIQMSMPLFKAYSIYNFYTEKYPFDVMVSRLLTRPLISAKNNSGNSIMDEIMSSDIDEAKAEFASFIQVANAPQTLACIRNTLTSSLQIFNEYKVKKLCRTQTINFSDLRKENTVLYIQIPERYSKHYAPITSVLMQQLMDRLLDYNEGLDVFFLIDELCNIGKLQDLPSYLSTCRKHNISISACIQNLTQLQRVYGEIEGKELQELFKTLIVSGGLKDSNEYFTDLMGVKEVKEDNKKITKPLMTSDELRRLSEKEVIILSGNKRPVKDKIKL